MNDKWILTQIEYTQGKVDSENVEIRYSLRPMT